MTEGSGEPLLPLTLPVRPATTTSPANKRGSFRNLGHSVSLLQIPSALPTPAQGGVRPSARGTWTGEQLRFHLGRLLKEFTFFAELASDVQASLPSILNYEFESKGNILFNQGDGPGRCYILLTGTVEIWKDDATHDDAAHDVVSSPCGNDRGTPESQSTASMSLAGSLRRPRNSSRHVPVTAGSAAVVRKCKAMADMMSNYEKGLGDFAGGDPLSPSESVSGSMLFKSPRPSVVPASPPLTPQWDTPGDGCDSVGEASLDEFIEPPGIQVAALGPGMLFGELALLEDQPRNATVRCKGDCEFLVIEREDFEKILKRTLLRAHDDKLEFLRSHVPGFSELPEKKADDISYLFKKASFAKNHVFARQGGQTNGIVTVIAKGAAEISLRSEASIPVFEGLPEIGSRRLGVIVTGGIFGSPHMNHFNPFTVTASTSPCDVYQLSREELRRLPEVVLHGLREVIEQSSQWRILRCDSPAEMAGVLTRKKKHNGFGKKKKPWRTVSNLAWPDSNRDTGPVQFELAPGECIAMTGSRPPLRKLASGTRSTPNLGRPNTGSSSRALSRPGSTAADESTFLTL